MPLKALLATGNHPFLIRILALDREDSLKSVNDANLDTLEQALYHLRPAQVRLHGDQPVRIGHAVVWGLDNVGRDDFDIGGSELQQELGELLANKACFCQLRESHRDFSLPRCRVHRVCPALAAKSFTEKRGLTASTGDEDGLDVRGNANRVVCGDTRHLFSDSLLGRGDAMQEPVKQ